MQPPPNLNLPDPPQFLRDAEKPSTMVLMIATIIGYLQELSRVLKRLTRHQSASYQGSADHGSSHNVTGSDPLDTPGTPTTISPDDSAAVGDGPAYAREDHKHAIATGAPSTTGTANSEGVSTSFARADHVHLTGVLTGKGQIQGHSATIPVAISAGIWPEHLRYDENASDGTFKAKPWYPWGSKTSLTSGVAATLVEHKGLSGNTNVAGMIQGMVRAKDATDSQCRVFQYWWTAVTNADGSVITSAGTDLSAALVAGGGTALPVAVTAGTLTLAFTIVDDAANDKISIQITATTSIATPTSIECEFTNTHFDYNDATVQL